MSVKMMTAVWDHSTAKDSGLLLLLAIADNASDRPNQVDVIVAKHRNGPTGTANLFFKKDVTQMANLRKTSWALNDNGRVVRPGAAPLDLGGAL